MGFFPTIKVESIFSFNCFTRECFRIVLLLARAEAQSEDAIRLRPVRKTYFIDLCYRH